jgi:hypothetical protein
MVSPLDFQQPLLQKNQPRGASNTTISDQALKYDRDLAPQQDTSAASHFVSNGREQLKARLGDVAANDQNFWIENVQKANDCSGQVFEGAIQHTACAFIALGRGTKNSLSAGRPASFPGRQPRGRSTVKMGLVIGLDGAGRKARFHAASVSADTQSAMEIEGYMSEMAGGSGRSVKNRTIYQHRSPYTRAQRQQNHVALSAGSAPEYLRDQRRASVIVSVHG